MATTYRTNSGLRSPGHNDPNWDVPLEANFTDLDASPMYGALCVTPAEFPSGSLNVHVSAGRYRNGPGPFVSYGGGTLALAASSTLHVYLDAGGVLTSNAAWPSAYHVPLATVVTDVSTLTSVTDARVPLASAGAPVPTVAGSRGGNAALQSLLTALAGLGLITDSTSA